MDELEFAHAEGATPLDPDEAADLIPTHINTMGALNEWEQTNILKAEEWLFNRKFTDLLNDDFVRELHRRMFDETWKWAGTYRKSDKNLGVHWPSIGVAVRETLRNASHWIEHSTFNADGIAIRLHHKLVAVHPFPNGNGRHTRLFADAYLFQQGQARFTWGRVNLQSAGDARKRYLEALKEADKENYSPLLQFARS